MANETEHELTRRIEKLEEEVKDLRQQIDSLRDRLKRAEASIPNPAY